MKDGKLEQILKESERLADTYERSLPHLSDSIRQLIEIIHIYDKNQKALIKCYLKIKRANEWWEAVSRKMMKYLSPEQSKYVQNFIEGLEYKAKEVIEDDPS